MNTSQDSGLQAGKPQSFPRSLRGKLVLSHLAVIVVAITAASLLLLSLARAYFLDSLEQSLLVQAQLVASNLIPGASVPTETSQLSPVFNTVQQQTVDNLSVQLGSKGQGESNLPQQESNLAYLSQVTVELGTVLDAQIRVLDQRAIVLIDSTGQLEGQTMAQDAAIMAALGGEMQRSIKPLDNENWLFLAVPVHTGDEIAGVIQLGQPLRDVFALLNDLRWRLLLAALLAVPVGAAVGLYLARNLTHPIQALTHAAQDLSRGDFEAPLPQPGRDELGLLNRTFEHMRQQLQREERMRIQFVSDVSHELRTPLTALKGLAETLRDGAVDDPMVRDRFLAAVENETDRLIRLVNDLLMLSRADTQALVMHKQPVHVHALLQQALQTLNPQFKEKEIRVDLMLQSEALCLQADPDRMEQVLLNILDNALKYTPAGGVIRLQGSHWSPEIDPRPALHEKLGPGPWILLSIADSGPGIHPHDLPHVFDRFYRADPARGRDQGGAGLGLAISKALIEAHGGQIWIESPAQKPAIPGGTGTSVHLLLPSQRMQTAS